MNNIQKMENKAYKAYIKEVEANDMEKRYCDWVKSNRGRSCIIKGIRGLARIRVATCKINETKYQATKKERDICLKLAESRGC